MELSAGSAARRDPEVRAELKKQQQARLAVKAKVLAGEIEASQYSEMYASQPEQVARKAIQDQVNRQRREARRAQSSAALANAKGGAAVFDIGEKPKKGSKK